MAATDPASPHDSPFEALKHQSSFSSVRRARPPEIEATAEPQSRVPLRPGKSSKRESVLGLRNLFSKPKPPREDQGPGVTRRDIVHRPPGGSVRTSVADFNGNWGHVQVPPKHAPRPVGSVPDLRPTAADGHGPSSAARHGGPRHQKPSANMAKVNQPVPPAKPSRRHLATWDPPPLFKAYPQAIKDAHLLATVLSADAILRYNEKRPSGGDASQSMLDLTYDPSGDASDERMKKLHRRDRSGSNKLDWTSKIYVLCTSGYLLQYSGEGHFARLPEKMLHLGKDSAAFVSDAIPGRHWVLQVSSAMEANMTTTNESKSFFSRLPFRSTERRSTSNFLMVFGDAEEMESWIAVLRREIEALGGKKSTTETGKLKAQEEVVQLKARPSQRTLVVRDPDRFSKVKSQDFSWIQDQKSPREEEDDDDGSSTAVATEQRPSLSSPDVSFDDISTTNSIVSTDGYQLDSLREKDPLNRLSYISTGQRTVVTSSNSSPACSPLRESFSTYEEEPNTALEAPPPPHQARLRPNASAILDRRQSTQYLAFTENGRGKGGQQAFRPQFTIMEEPTTKPCPNFSVPTSKRFSQVKTSPTTETPPATTPEADITGPRPGLRNALPRPMRRAPPAALALSMSRPLSVVSDQPSPAFSDTSRHEGGSAMSLHGLAEAPSPGIYAQNMPGHPVYHERNRHPSPRELSFPSRRASFLPQSPNAKSNFVDQTSPRKTMSMDALQQQEAQQQQPQNKSPRRPPELQYLARASGVPPSLGLPASSLPSPTLRPSERSCAPRSRSSIGDYNQVESDLSPSIREARQRANKRSSVYVEPTKMNPASPLHQPFQQPSRRSLIVQPSASWQSRFHDQEKLGGTIAIAEPTQSPLKETTPVPPAQASHPRQARPPMPVDWELAPTIHEGEKYVQASGEKQQQKQEQHQIKARNRRSMPNVSVANGPPPAPPPTHALPPLPAPPPTKDLPPVPKQKIRVRS